MNAALRSRWTAALAPGFVGIVLGLCLLVWRPSVRLVVSTHPGLAAAGCGVAGTVVVAAFLTGRQSTATLRAAERLRATEDARAAHRLFLHRLDHELKNPITAVRAALAAYDGPKSDHLRAADSQAARLADLVSELRKLSEMHTYPLEWESLDLEDLTRDAIGAVQEQLAASGGGRRYVVMSFPTAPWEIPPIQADPDLLYLAVYNVLSNAGKFSTDGDRIEVRASEESGFVALEIADTGIGIPPAELHSVWDELSRASNARGTTGSGLGLSLVRIVIERHGGSVAVRSRPEQGTSIRLRLPVRHEGQHRPTRD